MEIDERRQALLTGARLVVAAALGAAAAVLGLSRPSLSAKDEGYCDRAGRCAGCGVTASCDVFRMTHGGARP